jgi:hypothetical protein
VTRQGGTLIDNNPDTGPIPIYYPTLIPASFLGRIAIWAWGLYGIWQGAWTALGGDQRWGGPTYAVLRQLPHPTLTWGVALIICGVLTLIGSGLQMMRKGKRRAFVGLLLKGAGLVGIAVWCICLAWGGLTAARTYPTAPATAGPTYTAIAVAVIILIFVDERTSQNRHPR